MRIELALFLFLTVTGSICAQSMDQVYVNLCQYGVYYNHDLEWFAQNPNAYQGGVRSNHSIYLGSQTTFDVAGSVRCAGHIYNTPKDTTLQYAGVVRIANSDFVWHELSYDWRDPDWVSHSLSDWGGLVQDSSHGIQAAPFPIEALVPPIEIIKRGTMEDGPEEHQLRFYYRAGLKIIDGIATDSSGNVIYIPPGVITASAIYDFREGHHMEMRNISIAVLIASGLVPPNKMVYVSYSHINAAVRLTNASQLPEGGLLVATDNPLYVWGNFNTVNKQRSVILCDAFNVYSPNWNDANSTRQLNQRNATPTTINTALVTGNTETISGSYSGGVDALIRLHERWQEASVLTFRGTLVCLWESEQATGSLQDASFSEHHRDAAFDPDLVELIPLAPEGLTIRRWADNDIRLRWAPVRHSIGGEPLANVLYHIHAATSEAGPFSEIGVSDSTVYVQEGIIGGQTRYFYRVTASVN